MKAILKFDLDVPEDVMAHKRCIKSVDMALTLFEIQHNLIGNIESYCKSTGKDLDIDVVIDQMNEIFDKNNIIIDELID